MPPRIFIVGATGYAGGDFLTALADLHADFEIRVLVRSLEKSRVLATKLPFIHCVVSTSHDVLVKESQAADVVVQIANADDESLSFALLEGVSTNHAGIYIHISGNANLIDLSLPLGESDPTVSGDANPSADILSLPRDRVHAAIEQDLVAKAEATKTKLVILSFPMLYGKGRGLMATHAQHFELYVKAVLAHGKAFVLGAGANVISSSHVVDATAALLFIIEEALKGESSRITWGRDGYYMVESSESSFREDAKEVAEVLYQRALIPTAEVDNLNKDTVSQFWPLGPLLWGSNSRSRAEKLRSLGWRPSAVSRRDSLNDAVDSVLGPVDY